MSAATAPSISLATTQSVKLLGEKVTNAPDSNIIANTSAAGDVPTLSTPTKSVEALEKALMDAIRAAKAEPAFPWSIQDVAPGASIRGLKFVTDTMQRIAVPQDPGDFEEGGFVWIIVAEPTSDRDVLERSRGNVVHTDHGLFVIKLRPGIIIEKHARHCTVAEMGRRGDRVLDGLSLVDLIERMGVLPLHAAPFDPATLSEDDELYRLIYTPLRIAEYYGPGKPLNQNSIVQFFRTRPCAYNNHLLRAGRLETESFSRLLATPNIAKQLRTDLSTMATDPRLDDLKTRPINRRPRETLSGFQLRAYGSSMALLKALRLKAEEYVARPANHLRTPERRVVTGANARNRFGADPIANTVSNDTAAMVQTSLPTTASSSGNFVATTSVHPDRRAMVPAPTLIQAVERDSCTAYESVTKELIPPLQVARDIARMEWEMIACDTTGVDVRSKKRKLAEATNLHDEAKTLSITMSLI
ncbi:hypothetical protein J4E85_000997 [Alternaria conjuncta]|uniref:uncharacterized protein n=1 Tax=Alternaria conjuncta TaxID=181017 RepID=UPI00221EE7A7|nr:uncharacterized protein J4E85_000997 [Alternaria conjuncta]KAI4938556.1 hypothetical protein J4E85_000997 [Alternaria conjuncta]